jgi:FkbM family methyltransferase
MVSQFKKNIEASFRYVHFYGLLEGTKISMKFLFNAAENVSLSTLKAPVKLRKGTSDAMTFHKVFGYKEYAIKQFEENPKVIIDGGSNIGLFSIFMKNLYPDARIIAIEPDDDNFKIMQENFASYSGIEAIKAGLWNKSKLLKVHDKYNQGKWAMVVEETDNPQESNVSGISIDEIMLKYKLDRIDILKIDIETSEKYLFEENYQNWLPKVKMIIIEFHDWIVKGTAQPVLKAVNECFNKYSFYMKGENAIIVNEDI